ncbi:MAG: hypothetical protein KAI71_01810 [Candidatus Pacebacteria bacterium]|nr:hypothetical protein [Candidatus Paceibacterota bacterium]
MEKGFQKVCAICDRLFMTDDERRETCVECSFEPMHLNIEVINNVPTC